MFALRKRPCINIKSKDVVHHVDLISKQKYEKLVQDAVNFLKVKILIIRKV